MHEEDADFFEFQVDDSLVEYDQEFHLESNAGNVAQQMGTGEMASIDLSSSSLNYSDKDIMLLATTCAVVGVSVALLWWRTGSSTTGIMSLNKLNEAIQDNIDFLKDGTDLDSILEEVLAVDAELKKNICTLPMDTLHRLHSQLERMEGRLSAAVEGLQGAEHTGGSYLDCLQQVRTADLVSRVNSVLQPAKSALDTRLHAHVGNSLRVSGCCMRAGCSSS